MYSLINNPDQPADFKRLISRIGAVERARGRREASAKEQGYGHDMDTRHLVAATAAAMRMEGMDVDEARIGALVRDRTQPETAAEAAALGYAELLKLILDRADEIPFIENQVKYFHSMLLRHDEAAAGHRRTYRRTDIDGRAAGAGALPPAPPADEAAKGASELVAWARAELEDPTAYPLVVVALFLYRFLVLRPFADGNGRLALALANYLLARHGLGAAASRTPVEVAVERRHAEWLEALRANDAASWVALALETVAESLRDENERGDAAAPRINPRQERLLAALRGRGAAKIGELLVDVPMPRATAKKDLKGLVGAGYLATTGVGKGTVYRRGPRG